MWDLPGPGLEPVSLALAGRFLTTAPPGKSPRTCVLNHYSTLPLIYLLIDVQLIYNVVLVSGIQQSDSVIHIYIYMCTYVYIYSLLKYSFPL